MLEKVEKIEITRHQRDWSGHPTKAHTHFHLLTNQNHLLFSYLNQFQHGYFLVTLTQKNGDHWLY